MITLLADIGGTNACFALADGNGHGPVVATLLDLHSDALACITHARNALLAAAPCRAILAVAGPVFAGRAQLTNRGWQFDADALAAALSLDSVTLVNDFQALAAALPLLRSADLRQLGGGAANLAAPRVVLGPGTGLGVAAFVPPCQVLPTEGGHATLPAHDAREAGVISVLRQRFGHVSAERCLAGPGLENLHGALRVLDGLPPIALPAHAITAEALAGTCPICVEALAMFCAMLGGVAGDHALGFGATGGVYLAGGILPRFPDFLARSAFRARFEAKGRFRPWLEAVPTALIVRPQAALLGLAAIAGQG